MRVRPYQLSDAPILRELAARSGFPYIDPESPMIETARIVESDDGNLLMACAAERIVQLFLWSEDFEPAAKLAAIRLLARDMGAALKRIGYDSAEAYLPPQIERSFRRRLSSVCEVSPNWVSLNLKI